MSYLSTPRIVFHGQFQADVSTVNNDVRHFSNQDFEERFQDFQKQVLVNGAPQTIWNGWWNPRGSGAFRLSGCVVQSVVYGDGQVVRSQDEDPIIGAQVLGAEGRSPGKLVDIDPQWQLCSQIWGMGVRLVPERGPSWMRAEYLPAAFRDLYFGRTLKKSSDSGASAVFPSSLTEVQWAHRAKQSRIARELQQASQEGRLSIRLTTYGYANATNKDDFTYGMVSGVIGPALEGEPDTFVLGRRMVASNGVSTAAGFNFFDCRVDGSTVLADLANALPLEGARGPFADLGELRLAVLLDASIQEGQVLTPEQYHSIGTIPYLAPGFLETDAAIFQATLDPQARALIGDHPLAVLGRPGALSSTFPADSRVLIRESPKGRFLRVDNFVQRLDAGETGAIHIWAAQYGKPLADEAVTLRAGPPMADLGGGPSNEYDAPSAPIPVANTPVSALQIPAPVTTNHQGLAVQSLGTSDPGNPRGYIEGQLYVLQPTFVEEPVVAQQFDVLALLLHDAAAVPARPKWADIQDWMQQYANLYPIMSRMLVDLGDRNAVLRMAHVMEMGFALPIEHPNHMPVTRDLSGPRRETVLRWLRQLGEGDHDGDLAHFDDAARPAEVASAADHGAQARAAVAAAHQERAAQPGSVSERVIEGKSRFYSTLQRARGES